MHVAEVLPSAAVAAERHHAQYRGLGVVARVFGATFALRDPDVVIFASDHPVHVATHVPTGFQKFAFTDGTPHDECFVHAHEAFDPGVDEQCLRLKHPILVSQVLHQRLSSNLQRLHPHGY